MFDIGWSELMMIGIVALIVIGPKDLPDMFRTLGRFTSKARGMARDFQRAMESAANETGVKDVAADLKKATSARSMGLDAVKDAASRFEKWDPMAPLKTQAKTAPKPDPDAAPPATAAPLAPPEGVSATGPNTQALAEAQARRRAERTAAAQDGAAARMGPAAEAGPGATPDAARPDAGPTRAAPKFPATPPEPMPEPAQGTTTADAKRAAAKGPTAKRVNARAPGSAPKVATGAGKPAPRTAATGKAKAAPRSAATGTATPAPDDAPNPVQARTPRRRVPQGAKSGDA